MVQKFQDYQEYLVYSKEYWVEGTKITIQDPVLNIHFGSIIC